MSPMIPQYEAKRNITAQTPEPMRQEVADRYEPIKTVTQALTSVAQQWQKANTVMQATKSKANWEMESAIIQANQAADPDYNNVGKYIDELAKAKSRALEGIEDKSVQQQLAIQYNMDSRIAQIKMEGDAQDKQLVDYRVDIAKSLEMLQMKKRQAATPQEITEINSQIDTLMNGAMAIGAYNKAQIVKLLDDSNKLGVQYDIYADNSTKEQDSRVLEELRKGESGAYKDIAASDRLSLIKQSQDRIFQNNQTYKRENENIKNARFDDIFDKINQGTLVLADIDREMEISEEQGGIPKRQLLNIKEGIQRKVKSDLETIISVDGKAEEYLDFIDNFIDDENDRQKARELLSKAYKDMILSSSEATVLNKIKNEAQEIQFARSTNIFTAAVRSIQEQFGLWKATDEKDAALAIKELLTEMANGKDITQAAQDIISQKKTKLNPALLMLTGTAGVPFMDTSGIVKLVFPDGRVEDTEGSDDAF
jgi:hypothetical protein